MKISSKMNLDNLIELMDVNGEGGYTLNQARAMRQMICANASAFGWRSTNDIDDSDWFTMLDAAIQH